MLIRSLSAHHEQPTNALSRDIPDITGQSPIPYCLMMSARSTATGRKPVPVMIQQVSVEFLVAATGDGQDLAADPTRSRRTQKQGSVRDVGGLAKTPEWGVLQHLRLDFVGQHTFERRR